METTPGRASVGRGSYCRSNPAGRGISNRKGRGGAVVGKEEADSLRHWTKATTSTYSNISFASLWKGAKAALQTEHSDATKVLLRMEVDTDDPEPEPLPEMPRWSNKISY